MFNSRRSYCLFLFVIGASWLTVPATRADTGSTWNTTTGNWSNPADWTNSPTSVNFPNNGNSGLNYGAVLNNSGTITLDQNITVNNYSQNSGILTATGAFSLTVDNAMNWTAGTIGGTTAVTIANGATLTFGSGAHLGNGGNTGSILTNNGTANLSSTVTLADSGGASPGTTIINNSIFNTTGTSTISRLASSGSLPSFVNNAGATFNNTTATSTVLGTTFTDSGTVTTVAGGTINLNGAVTLNDGAHFTGAGVVTMSAAGSTISGTTTIGSGATLSLNSGSLAGTGTFAGNGTVNWIGGSLSGNGTTTIASGTTLNISGAVFKPIGDTNTTSHTLINNGTVNLNTPGFFLSIGDSIGPVSPSMLINNGTFNMMGTSSISQDAFPGSNTIGVFVNGAGSTLNKTGAGMTSSFTAAFSNQGTIQVSSGTLQFLGSATQTAGRTIVASGASLSGNPIFNGGALGGGGTVADSGTLSINNGSTLEPGLGASAGQTLSIQNNVAMSSGSTYQVDFFNGTSADQLNVGGNASFNGSLAINPVNGILPAYNQTFSIANITGTRTGTFGLTEGQSVGYGLYVSFVGGDGNDIQLSSGLAPGAAPIGTATSTQPAYVSGNYSSANTGVTYTFQSLNAEPGTTAILGPNDTLTLTTGPLVIAPGAVFTGNGLINGNVINHGLLRIPIVRLDTVSNIQGGYTEVTVPAPGPGPVISSPDPIIVHEGTIIGIGGGNTGGGGGGGGGGNNPITINTPGVSNPGVVRLAPPPGTVGYDASLAITGTFTQTDTGKLRLFVGGDQKGVTYSHLDVGEAVTLSGEIQLVLEPDLFGFLPTFGETFDLIESPEGITIPGDLTLSNFVTQDGASYVNGLPLTPYDSGIENDPDHLDQIGQQLFTYNVVDGGTVLQATYVGPVPEPASSLLLALGAVALGAQRRRLRNCGA